MFDPTTYKDKPKTTNATAKVLRDAAAYIDNHGWWDGNMGNCEDKNVCAGNAISKVSGDCWSSAHEAFAMFVGEENSVTIIFEWNDATGRTKEEVMAALEGAAASMEESS